MTELDYLKEDLVEAIAQLKIDISSIEKRIATGKPFVSAISPITSALKVDRLIAQIQQLEKMQK